MTHRQFHLLIDRHREARAHTELVHGWTTAAVINWSMNSPDKPASALDFMPSHQRDEHIARQRELTPEEMKQQADYQRKVNQLAAEMLAGSGSLYDEICLGKT